MSENLQHVELNDVAYCRDKYIGILAWIKLLAVLALILATFFSYLCLKPQSRQYYAATEGGVVVPLYPLNQPGITKPYLLQWAALQVRNAFNLSFLNPNKQLEKLKPIFTDKGYKSFISAMNSSGLLDVIEKQKLDVSAVVSGNPVVLAEQNIVGRHMWRIQMPVLIKYEGASAQSERQLIITLDISRVPVLTAPLSGIQITDFEAQGK